MKPVAHQDVAHNMSLPKEAFQRLDGPIFRLALASTLVLVGIYLYLVPNTITVSEPV